MSFVPQPIKFGIKFSFLLKIYTNYMKKWLKYVLLVDTRCVLASPHVLN
jgi:hypothetical protein